MVRRFLLPASLLGCLLFLAAAPANPANKLTVTGLLQTGIVAPGGETTGTLLRSSDKKTVYELDLGNDVALRKKADNLSGKQVKVRGTLIMKKGVEGSLRQIILVDTLDSASEPLLPPATNVAPPLALRA